MAAAPGTACARGAIADVRADARRARRSMVADRDSAADSCEIRSPFVDLNSARRPEAGLDMLQRNRTAVVSALLLSFANVILICRLAIAADSRPPGRLAVLQNGSGQDHDYILT